MLLNSWNQGREVTVEFGNMKIFGDPDMSHFHEEGEKGQTSPQLSGDWE